MRSYRGKAYRAIAALFFSLGAGAASWLIHIPHVKGKLDLSSGELGVVLLAYPVATLLAMPLTGWLVARYGGRRITRASAVVFCACLCAPVLAVNAVQLVAGLMMFGMADGMLAICLNAQGSGLEKRMGRPILSSFHAFFSLGGFVGAAMGGLATHYGIGALVHLLYTDAALIAVFMVIRSWMHEEPPAPRDTKYFVLPDLSLLSLCLIGFCVLLGEGGMASWSAVYLHDSIGATETFAAYGYAVFSVAMAAGRFLGDRINMVLGPVTVLRWGGVLAAAGLGLGLLLQQPIVALVGFGMAGLGYSIVFPITLAAASRSRTMPSSMAVASVSTVGYFAFLVGPPLIGLLAEYLTVRGALLTFVLSSFLIVTCARGVAPAPDPAGAGFREAR